MSRARLPILRGVPSLSRSLSVACRRKGPNEAIFPRKDDGPTAGVSSSSWARGESPTAEAVGVPRSLPSRSRPGLNVSIRRVTDTCLRADKGSRKISLLDGLLLLGQQLPVERHRRCSAYRARFLESHPPDAIMTIA